MDNEESLCPYCSVILIETSNQEEYKCPECFSLWITPEKHQRQIDERTATVLARPKKYKKRDIGNVDRWEVWERDNFTCQECGARRNLTIDHIHAEVLGGENSVENYQTLCRTCNSRKGARI